jgi:hypothetical protein
MIFFIAGLLSGWLIGIITAAFAVAANDRSEE